ncbi:MULTISPECIES: hypothetical protein [Haloferax]|uniref:DUF7322 domain-containing protein n=2 Tax=Haloferax TaxID=2251 RepID=A0A6G1Z5X5_9EURY|nr:MULTISPECIES: hypothetical protein [Haloferax]KAB1189070.1 hypothetical protein Hfx1149_13915 [Haloferax sp. CBA1149]MRW81801.1 hypothetical protein [Haloferax marinisediminis]
MTNDERREDELETSDSSSGSTQNAERPAHDVASGTDRVKRWADPESRWGNPERDLPKIPRVKVPGQEGDGSLKSEFSDDAPDLSADIDPELSRLFWASVLLANVGVAGITLGPMLVYFRGQLLIGAGVTALGIGALVRVYSMYQEYKATDWSSDDDEEAESTDDDSDTPDDERNR